jgi:hypothetical protein
VPEIICLSPNAEHSAQVSQENAESIVTCADNMKLPLYGNWTEGKIQGKYDLRVLTPPVLGLTR